MAKHARLPSSRQLLERALGKAIAVSLVAELVALATGRVPWPSFLICLVCVSYLVEALGHGRAVRAADEEAELQAILDAEDAREAELVAA